MQSLKTEIIELRAEIKADKARHHEKKLSEALGRLNEALEAVLPQTEQETYRYGPNNMYTGFGAAAVTYKELLPPVIERIKAGAPTADDKRVLDALPGDALVVIEGTALGYLEMICDMYTRY